MTVENVQDWIIGNRYVLIPVVLVLSYGLYRLSRLILARGLFFVALRTENVYDDLIVDALYPFRVAWLVPLALLYYFSYLSAGQESVVKNIVLLLIIVEITDFSISLLSGVNEVYKHHPRYSGVSVAGYIGLLKILVVLVAVVIVISMFAQAPPAVLLSGLGAWLAVLLLIFRDTILSFVASVRISTQQLIKEGDMLEVPSFDSFGFVVDVNLHAISVENFDKTMTVIPTAKIVDVPYKNWRAMIETGGRRIRRALIFDITTIRFCDLELLEGLSKYDLLADFVNGKVSEMRERQLESTEHVDFPLDGPQVTNVQLFVEYAKAYMRQRKDIHKKKSFPFVVRTLEPDLTGLPVQINVYTRETDWDKYEAIQDEIMLHLLAAAPYFDLEVFQQASEWDRR
jgi:miniconductance mechanosensitive channel